VNAGLAAAAAARYPTRVFIGHFGLAFGAKRLAPRLSLGVLFAAAQALDLLWPVRARGAAR
jgi:hypothetical protein